MTGAVLREISVCLGRKVRSIERQQCRLDMEAAVLRMHPKHARRRCFPLCVLSEGVFYRGNAFVERQQPLDIAAAEDKRFSVSHRWLTGTPPGSMYAFRPGRPCTMHRARRR